MRMAMKEARYLAATVLLAAAIPAGAAPAADADATIARIRKSAEFRKASAAISANHERWVADVIALTEVPAPPFGEKARGEVYQRMFVERGLTDVHIDKAGNVIGLRKGSGKASGKNLVIVAAHLDTVFPAGTPIKVRREGNRLMAPGVGDNSAGLATQLAIIDAMKAGGIKTDADILFVGSAGEEGRGDLSGVRAIFDTPAYRTHTRAFIAFDGAGPDSITITGVGSRRYRMVYSGPGGHSFGSFGLVNPAAAMARAIDEIYKLRPPANPKTTYSASVFGGGTSINAIPREVWFDFDMRSESAQELSSLERQVMEIVKRSVVAENAARSTKDGSISLDAQLVGDRPAGSTSADADLVRFSTAAYATEGVKLSYRAASTDSNVPMSLGIPAITIPRDAESGRAHALDEWVSSDAQGTAKMLRTSLLTIVAAASN